MQRLQKFVLGKLRETPRHSHHSHRVHRHEDAVDADESYPEMELAETFMHEASKHLRKPEVSGRKHAEDRSHTHHQMEVCRHEIGVVHRQIERSLAQYETRNSAGNE